MKVLLSIINSNVKESQKHKHAAWELVYRLSGESNTTVGNKSYRISAGDLYIIPPETDHFDASKEQFSDLVMQVDFLEFSEVAIFHDNEGFIDSIARMINQIISRREDNFQSIADILMEALVRYIKRFSVSEEQNPLVQRLKNLIFENIENCDFDISKEIENMGYNSDYIRRCFKNETKKTPLSYLTELRINRAKQLLVMPTYESVESVSLKCGFRDSFYFSTCFKKHIGLSPLRFRKENL